jgi:hypothetical protein
MDTRKPRSDRPRANAYTAEGRSTVPTKSIIDIAMSAVPDHVRGTAKLVVHPSPAPKAALSGKAGARARTAATPADVAARLAAKLGVKPKKRALGAKSGDVEFVEKTPVGKRSIVVQVREGKVKQVIKRAAR